MGAVNSIPTATVKSLKILDFLKSNFQALESLEITSGSR